MDRDAIRTSVHHIQPDDNERIDMGLQTGRRTRHKLALKLHDPDGLVYSRGRDQGNRAGIVVYGMSTGYLFCPAYGIESLVEFLSAHETKPSQDGEGKNDKDWQDFLVHDWFLLVA